MQKKRVVVIGGGTGTHTVLSGLKKYQKELDITAIVTMADSGGSTGRLRDEFGYLPVGDVRMALAALAGDIYKNDRLVRKLLLYRFNKGNGLSGHTLGNLLLVALTDILGSEEKAIRATGEMLKISGKVLPVTTEKTDLVATYTDGTTITGEHEIDEPTNVTNNKRIKKLTIKPSAKISKTAQSAILNSDMVVLGPGDLYTSVLANCVIDGVARAIGESKSDIIYISNLMTRQGQTTNMGVDDHVNEIHNYIGCMPKYVLVNKTPLPKELLEKYATEGEYPVKMDLNTNKTSIISDDLLSEQIIQTVKGDVLKRSLIRHDPDKLARKIVDLLL